MRLRDGTAAAPTLVLAVDRGAWSARLLAEGAAALAAGERAVEHEALGVGARFAPGLVAAGPARLAASLGADAALLSIARVDRAGGSRHLAFEPVLAAGLRGGVRLGGDLALALEAEALLAPAAPRVSVPGGPETALGAFGGRLVAGLELR